jgi:site-specific recombinase XerD
LPPLDAEAEDIKQYRQYLIQSGYQNSTIATSLNIIRIFYKAALTHGLISSNPAQKIKAPKERKDPAARITFKIEDIVRQGLKTGLKVSAKRASRIVPLTDNLATQLEEYLEIRRKVLRRKLQRGDYVFISLSNNSKGQQLSRRSCASIIDRYLIATNLKHAPGTTLSAHSLRHTAGTLSLRTGADLRQVQDLLGHADPRTTSIYAHLGDRWEHNPGAGIEEQLDL